MDRWVRVGWVVLVVGLLLLAVAAVGLDRDILARATVFTNVEYQSAGPVDLPAGSCTIWVEDFASWPDDLWEMDLALNLSDEFYWGSQPGDKRYRDIEGMRCFLVSMIPDIPAGEYRIYMELWDYDWGGAQMEAALFILSSPGPAAFAGLMGGTIMVTIGAATVAMVKWPGKKRTSRNVDK